MQKGIRPPPWGGGSLVCGVLAMVLTACAMPSLETGSNLLTVPPGGHERAAVPATSEPAMAQLSTGENEPPVLLGAVSQTSLQTGGAMAASGNSLEPLPVDGIMRGEFQGSSVAFADGDGLVCAGRLIGRRSELNSGLSVPVNCSDGSAGRVKVVSWASPDEAECVFYLDNSAMSPVRLVRSASLE